MRVLIVALTLGSACLPPFASIEEARFSQSLGVDLARSRRLPEGVFIRDLDATVPVNGTDLLDFTCFLADGAEVARGQVTSRKLYSGEVGLRDTIAGFQLGVFGPREWTKRQLIVPPELAYGDQGAIGVPPNAILVFEVSMVNP